MAISRLRSLVEPDRPLCELEAAVPAVAAHLAAPAPLPVIAVTPAQYASLAASMAERRPAMLTGSR